MAADPIVYCLEMLTDYDQFERLCHDLMGGLGYLPIEPLGGMKDKGRDALHISNATGETTIFAYSVREDWQTKLGEDANKIRSYSHPCDKLVFVTTSLLTATQRDNAKSDLRSRLGLALEVFALERLRTLLAGPQRHLLALHPQIFTPTFFAADTPTPKPDLAIRISPTRVQRRQLAQIRVFNKGTAPIYLDAWFADYKNPESTSSSVRCVTGRFPCRLVEQDAATFVVDIDEWPVEQLAGLGVVDGEHRRWGATDQELRGFISTAVANRPPLPPPSGPTAEQVKAAAVDIRVRRIPRAGTFDSLEVVFLNHRDIGIALRGAGIEWKFADGTDNSGVSEAPSVRESGGSVSLRRQSPQNVVSPGGECRFQLDDRIADALLSVLRPTVVKGCIVVGVASTTGIGWETADEGIAADIKAVASSILATWKD